MNRRQQIERLRALALKAEGEQWFVEHGATDDGLSRIDDGCQHGMFPIYGEAHEIEFAAACVNFCRVFIVPGRAALAAARPDERAETALADERLETLRKLADRLDSHSWSINDGVISDIAAELRDIALPLSPPPEEPSRDAQEEPDPWPAGCIKPGSCGRHEQCMYAMSVEKCRHYARNLAMEVHAYRKPALAAARQEGERG